MARAKEKIDEKKLPSWKLLDDFRRRLAKVRDARLAPLAERLKLIDGSLLPALPRMHWALWVNDTMAESPEGVAIQIYCALIAALMLQWLTGKRPGKRAMELIRMYLMGYAELDEVTALLGLEKNSR